MSKSNSSDCIEYRIVPGCPAYRVGSDGSVWSRFKQVGRPDGGGGMVSLEGKWKRLKPWVSPTGYLHVILYGDHIGTRKRDKRYAIQRLVLMTFVGPCPPGQQARHLNDIKTDNRLCNLAWGTAKQNCADRILNGGQCRGERSGHAILTEKLVAKMRAEVIAGEAVSSIARKHGLKESTARAAIRGQNWKYMPNAVHKLDFARGERHPCAKLTESEVIKIRELCSEGESIGALSRAYKCCYATILDAVQGKTWRHLPGAIALR